MFDIGNRLQSVTGRATHTYDGHGRRAYTAYADGSWQWQLYDHAGRLRYTHHSQRGATRHVYLGSQLIAETSSATGHHYIHADALGSPVARTNPSAQITSRTVYEPYGATAAVPGSTAPAGIGFTGHANDAESALVYMQQRYYDPVAGRFLSVDPVVTDWDSGGGFNRYVYVHNNPFKYTDPDGRQAAMAGCFGGPLGCAIGVGLTVTTIYVGAKAVSDTGRNLQNSSDSSGSGSEAGKKAEAAASPAAAAGAAESSDSGKSRNAPPPPLAEAEGRPHSIVERPGREGQYTTHNGDGTSKQYRGSGKDHGPIPRPNVKEAGKNVTPDGREFIDKGRVRPPPG